MTSSARSARFATLCSSATVQDPNQYPPDYSLVTYLWVAWLSWFGAASAYLGRLRHRDAREFSVFAFACEVVISSFVGLLAFYLCDWQGMDSRLAAVTIGTSSHFSTRTIFLMRKRILGVSDDEP